MDIFILFSLVFNVLTIECYIAVEPNVQKLNKISKIEVRTMINVINQNMRNNMSANKGRHLTLFNSAAFVKAASICQTKMAEGDSYIMAEQIQE